MIALNPSWEKAKERAETLMIMLNVHPENSAQFITRVDGKKRKGWRIVVVRKSDGMTKTSFVHDA
jgi:hypothetical protein